MLEAEKHEVAGLRTELLGLKHTLKIQEERLKQARLAHAKEIQDKTNSQKQLRQEIDKCKKRVKTVGEISVEYENRYAIELGRFRQAYETQLQQECDRESAWYGCLRFIDVADAISAGLFRRSCPGKRRILYGSHSSRR